LEQKSHMLRPSLWGGLARARGAQQIKMEKEDEMFNLGKGKKTELNVGGIRGNQFRLPKRVGIEKGRHPKQV